MAQTVLVMGPSGSGKTTLGIALARALECGFLDADDLHPLANVEKMRRGEPLTDEDRWPWLARVVEAIRSAKDKDRSLVVACSALKRIYRDRLRIGDPHLKLVALAVPQDVLEARLRARTAHFMPASLVASQIATLSMPAVDEGALVLDATRPVGDLVAETIAWMTT